MDEETMMLGSLAPCTEYQFTITPPSGVEVWPYFRGYMIFTDSGGKSWKRTPEQLSESQAEAEFADIMKAALFPVKPDEINKTETCTVKRE